MRLLFAALCVFLVVRAGREDAGVILDNLELGRRFLAGADLYAGNLHTPYPPSYGLLCAPLSLLPDVAARIAWAMLQMGCLVLLLVRFRELTREQWPEVLPKFDWIAALTLLLASRYLLRDTAGGGGNLIYATLVVESLRHALRGRPLAAALPLGAVLAIKPTPVVFVLFLAAWNPMAAALAALAGGLLFVAPALLHGTQWFGEQAGHWVSGVLAFARQTDVFAQPEYGFPPFTWMNQSLRCALGRFLGTVPERFLGEGPGRVLLDSALWFEGAGLQPETVAWITRLACALLLAAAVGSTLAHRRNRVALLFDAAAFFPLMLMLSPISWKAHRIALLLPFFLLAAQCFRAKRPVLVAALFVYWVTCVALSEELTGKQTKNVLQSLYLITVGDLMIFGLCLGEARRVASGTMQKMHTPAALVLSPLLLALGLTLGGCATGPVPCESLSCEPLPGRTLHVGGVRVHTVTHGRGEPVVLLHGIPTSSYLWRNVQRELADRCWTIAPDLMGLGRSDLPMTGGLDLEAQAETVRDVLDALGVTAAVLVAHDVGGGVAQIFAQKYPDRLRGLVLVDVVAFAEYWPVTMVAALRLPLIGELGSIAPQGPVLRAAIAKGLHRKEALTDGVFWRYHEPLSEERGRFRFLDFVRALDPARVEQAVRANADLRVPVLILWGEHDAYQPLEEGRDLHRTMKSSRFVVIPDAGHFVPEERPAAVAEGIEELLRETGPR